MIQEPELEGGASLFATVLMKPCLCFCVCVCVCVCEFIRDSGRFAPGPRLAEAQCY